MRADAPAADTVSRVAWVAFAAVDGACIGIVAGLALLVTYHCATGGSADPRCAVGMSGYVEVHSLSGQADLDRVSCQRRPGLVAP